MTLVFDLPGSSASPLGRIDPRWKLAGLLPAAATVAALRCWQPAAAALLASWLLAALGRLPLRWYLLRLAAVGLFLAPFLLWLPLAPHPAETPWEIVFLSISPAGVLRAAVLGLKSVAVVTLLLATWATAPWEVTLKAAHCLRVPGLLIQLLALTYRYLFLLAEELNRIRVALRVRGYRNRANLHSYRTAGQVAGALLVRGHERAERVGQAMRCRGFDGTYRALTDFQTKGRDVVVFLLLLAGSAGLVAWDFLLGWV